VLPKSLAVSIKNIFMVYLQNYFSCSTLEYLVGIMGKSRFLRRNYGKISFLGGGIITTSVNVAELWELIVF
jgi:hypothetical protein